MRIAVAGGTGVVGKHVVDAVSAAGHEPVVLARSVGVDLVSGAGVAAAMTDVDVAIDVSNVATVNRRKAEDFFAATTGNLLNYGGAAGVKHLVVLSIVGIDDVDLGYYLGKRKQEEVAFAGSMPVTVMRATQFHEFPGQFIDRSPGPVMLMPKWRTQPVAAAEVGSALVELALAEPTGRAPDLAGPEVFEMAELVRRVLRKRGMRRLVLQARHPDLRRVAGRAVIGIRGKRVAAVLLAVSAAVVGGWAEFAPRSFYDSFPGFGHHWVSMAGPYDEHLVRDVGGLYLALLVITVWVAARPSAEALRMVGLGWLVFNLAHLVFHLDHLDGFSTGDKVGNVVALSLAVLLALVLLLPDPLVRSPTAQDPP